MSNRAAALELISVRRRNPWLLQIILQLPLAFCLFSGSATADVRRFSQSSILIEGPIIRGDYDQVVALSAAMIAENDALPETRKTQMFSLSLRLNSPGGDVQEAFKISNFVREMWIQTELSDPLIVTRMNKDGELSETEQARKDETLEVGGDGPIVCYSACSLIFLAGISRSYKASELGRSVELGFHRPYINPEVNRHLSPDESKSVYAVLEKDFKEAMRRYGAPESLIAKTFNASSSDIEVLSQQQFQALFPTEEPWFGEYINAKCGSIKTAGDFSTKEEMQAYVIPLLKRTICMRLHIRDHQRSQIKQYHSLGID
jgi:hypothetical protein